MNRIAILSTIVGMIFIVFNVQAQPIESRENSIILNTNIGSQSIILPDPQLEKRIVKAQFWLSLDMGDKFVDEGNLDDIGTSIGFTLMAKKSGANVPEVFGANTFTLNIKREEPESHFLISLEPFIEGSSDENLSFDEIVIDIQTISPETLPNGMRFTGNYLFHYGYNIENVGAANTLTANTTSNIAKDVVFQWQYSSPEPISYFEFQLLRLYNINPDNSEDENTIQSEIDWGKAASVIVKPTISGTSYEFNYSIGEGSGFYVWRVRPVSDYTQGGFAIPQNYGPWSNAPATGNKINLTANPSSPYFFFNDEEYAKNYNISRVYNEEGKLKQTVTYANHLNQTRQMMSYLPSSDATIITHTVIDNQGRPALVTMPFPVAGKRATYNEDFLNTQSGGLYSADDFDSDANILNPTPVSGTGAAAYYTSGNNDNVPDAQGYPYTRTLFYNDGTGRVKEESGVGLDHKIQAGDENLKHTTRYLYGTTTEEELVALFGGEAPNPENVFKTITVDPNNVGSVTFTNKEGQVIATGLTFFESGVNSDALLDLDGETSVAMNVTNKLTDNSLQNGSFISSKRINIYNSGSILLNYNVNCQTLEDSCITSEFDCNYQVTLKTIRIHDDNTLEVIDNTTVSLTCDGGEASIDPHTVVISEPGTYIVQKELSPEGLDVNTSSNAQMIEDQVTPITSLIADWLANVEDRQGLESVFQDIEGLATAINDQELNTSIYAASFDANWLSESYLSDVTGFSLDVYKTSSGAITGFSLSTPCCKDMVVPVNWEPPYDYDEDVDGNGVIDQNEIADRYQDGIIDMRDVPDFEEFGLDILYDCILSTVDVTDMSQTDMDDAVRTIYYDDYMPGWKPGVFNEMVYHMLYDQYAVTYNGPSVVQYKGDILFACWASVANELKQQIPGCGNFDRSLPQTNISETFDHEYENDTIRDDKYEKDHDTHFDKSSLDLSFFQKIFISEKKISKRIREAQEIDPNTQQAALDLSLPPFHLVLEFLNCAGYKFAKILTPMDPNPLPSDYFDDESFTYAELKSPAYEPPVPIQVNSVSESSYIESSSYQKDDKSHYYLPLQDVNGDSWGPVDNAQKPLFPNIRNPYYAFKYFHYDSIGVEPAIESVVCFTDPNDCYTTSNGYYEAIATTNADGYPTWEFNQIPCCLSDPLGDPSLNSFCYHELNYPATNAPKYIVREFSDIGMVRCPYYHQQWSAGQNYAYFKLLSSYVKIDDEEENPGGSLPEITMNDYITPHVWYINVDETSTLNDIITDDTYTTLTTEQQQDYDILPFGELASGTPFVMVEKEMYDLVEDCFVQCDQRREQIRDKLYQMFNERCYKIGECRTNDPSTWDIIPYQDVEVMVEAVVAHFKEQCVLNTFSIESLSSRNFDSDKTVLGITELSTKLQYGMGGLPTGSDPVLRDGEEYDDNSTNTESGDSYPFAGQATFNSAILRYRFDTNADGLPDDWNPSWFQYTHLNQVKEWDFDLALPDKCQDVANTTPDCTDSPDHFVDRDIYQVNKNIIMDETNPALSTSVQSPKKIVTIANGPSN